MNMQAPIIANTGSGASAPAAPQFDLFNETPKSDCEAEQFPAVNFVATSYRRLPATTQGRAAANNSCIRLAQKIVSENRNASREEQAALMLFTGYGSSDLANNCFLDPATGEYRKNGWEEIARDLASITSGSELASLQRSTQYAHFTPEHIIRLIWAGVQRLGFAGGRVLEPGMGTGLFLAHMPEALRPTTTVLGIEADAVTATIAKLLFPTARIYEQDFARTTMAPNFSLAIGNPPFSAMVVGNDPKYRGMGLTLHDYFIAKSLDHLLPGAIGAFVTSQGTLNKSGQNFRRHVAKSCDLLGAIRLPEGAFAQDAGTDVGVDILFFLKRSEDERSNGAPWIDTITAGAPGHEHVRINEYFVDHPEMVLGINAVETSRFSQKLTYACKPRPGQDLEREILKALKRLPSNVVTSNGTLIPDERHPSLKNTSNSNQRLREGSYFVGADDELYQLNDNVPVLVPVKKARGDHGVFAKHAAIIRGLIPIRDTVREILALQEAGKTSEVPQGALAVQYGCFVKKFGPINLANVTTNVDENTGRHSETVRYPNIGPFRDDPDCWLVTSIENYDAEAKTASKGAIFDRIVVAKEKQISVETSSDALAVSLNTFGRVDIDFMSEILAKSGIEIVHELGDAIYQEPETRAWLTADEYLSGKVRLKLQSAIAAAAVHPEFERNVIALEDRQPTDIPPGDITARLGVPWISTDDIERFIFEEMALKVSINHNSYTANWTTEAYAYAYAPEAKARWATHRYSLHQLVSDALNQRVPMIYDDVETADGKKSRVLNSTETESAKEKQNAFRERFENWVWKCPERTARLARVYNDTYNNSVAREFDGSHMTLPGINPAVKLYDHQVNVIWRQVCAGSTYIAHAVGAGKTMSLIAGTMEQRRLGMVQKPCIVVPRHCLEQIAREFLVLYPNAQILVADDHNFAKENRRKFLARAATGDWDAIIITHSAFKFIPLPEEFEREMYETLIAEYDSIIAGLDRDDRLTRKKIERMKESYAKRIEGLETSKDDFLTMAEIGIDQIKIDEAQEFRKLSFTTNQTSLKGIDPNGSQMAWDLFCKVSFIRSRRRKLYPDEKVDRALTLASGTPITNTLGEMFTIQKLMDGEALQDRNIHEFDSWAATFGATRTELELQPSGKYKPVTRFSEFVNVPELIVMFRTFADVVNTGDLKRQVKLPIINGGKRQIITAPQSDSFKAIQKTFAERIKAIEMRTGAPKKGDDILLSVITDGRHAAIDLRLITGHYANDSQNKLNMMIANIARIHNETSDRVYFQPDNTAYERKGATQMVFSDLGTPSSEATRGFSVYTWVRSELVRLGIPAEQIAFVHDYNTLQSKNRLFADMRAGKIRIVLGSTKKMGTGVNAQNRLVALHHLDVPWLPSDIEQREGRIARQGNQNEYIDIYAYATPGSMDATMWQANERKARFIGAALSGDKSVRRLDDVGENSVNQFAMAKAIASGDPRLMQRSGLESEIARLERLKAAFYNERHFGTIRKGRAEREILRSNERIQSLKNDIEERGPNPFDLSLSTAGEVYPCFSTLSKEAGAALKLQVGAIHKAAMTSDTQDAAATIAKIGSLEIECSAYIIDRQMQTSFHVVTAESRYSISAHGTTPGTILIERIYEKLCSFEDRLNEEREGINRCKRMINEILASETTTFQYDDELDLKRAELDELEASLTATEGEGEGGSGPMPDASPEATDLENHAADQPPVSVNSTDSDGVIFTNVRPEPRLPSFEGFLMSQSSDQGLRMTA